MVSPEILYKVITGTTRPGGLQYQQGLKRETKGKRRDRAPKDVTIEYEIKDKHQHQKVEEREEESHPKSKPSPPPKHKTPVLFRFTKTSQSEISKKSLLPFPLVLPK